MSYLEMVDKAGDQAISALKQAEDAVVSVVGQASDFVGGIIPELPALPLSEQIPAPKEFVETSFGFVEKLVAAQKKYTLALLKALEPVTGKVYANSNGRKTRKAATSTKAA